MSDSCIEIIDALIARRNQKQWTQKDLADACGLLQSAIARFESKKVAPTLVTVQRIATALDVELFLQVKCDPEATL